MLNIRRTVAEDADAIWQILEEIIKNGDAFAYAPDSTREEMLDYWLDPNKHTYSAFIADELVGTFFMQNNQPGLGSHVANAGYATSPKVYGRGIGRQMGLFSLEEARRLGYKAMQFNIVVKSNERAVRLWQDIGFQIVGEIPEGFQHKTLGLVNIYIMHQKL
jgi:GNAT superfamily N-acetyltransferase